MVTKEAFEAFMVENGNKFPYNAVRTTRTSFITSWLLFCGSVRNGDTLFRPSPIYAVPSSCFDLNSITSLIVDQVAVPLPFEFGEIMNSLNWWGARINGAWEQDVLNIFGKLLMPRELAGPSRKDLFYYCLKRLMCRMVQYRPNKVQLLDNWAHYYDDYLYQPRSEFFSIATESIRWMEYRMMWGLATPYHAAGESEAEDNETEAPLTVSSAEE